MLLGLEQLVLFVPAAVLLSLSPGPDNLFVVTQSMVHGPRSGLATTAGLCTGLVVHTLLVSLGAAAIFQSSVLAFAILKYVGAAYLLYLAWQAFKSQPDVIQTDNKPATPLKVLYRRGVIMNLANPKVSVFFLAFLPQFVDTEAGHISLQLMALGACFIVVAAVIFSLLSLFAGQLGNRLKQSGQVQRWLQRIAGGVFTALAFKLALSEQGNG